MASIKTLLSASNKFQIVFKENLENHAIRWVTPWVKILTINNTINLFPYFFLYFFHPSSQLKLCVLETSFYMLAFPLFKTHYLWLNKWKTPCLNFLCACLCVIQKLSLLLQRLQFYTSLLNEFELALSRLSTLYPFKHYKFAGRMKWKQRLITVK